jgi:hypothetical protein
MPLPIARTPPQYSSGRQCSDFSINGISLVLLIFVVLYMLVRRTTS